MKKLIVLSLGSALLLTSTRCSDNEENKQQKEQSQTQPQQGDTTPSGRNKTTPPAKTAYALAEDDLKTIKELVFNDTTAPTYKSGFQEFMDAYYHKGNLTNQDDKEKIKPIVDLIARVKGLGKDSKDTDIEEMIADIEKVLDGDTLKKEVDDILDNGPMPTGKVLSTNKLLGLNGQKAALETGLKNLKALLDKEIKKIKAFKK